MDTVDVLQLLFLQDLPAIRADVPPGPIAVLPRRIGPPQRRAFGRAAQRLPHPPAHAVLWASIPAHLRTPPAFPTPDVRRGSIRFARYVFVR